MSAIVDQPNQKKKPYSFNIGKAGEEVTLLCNSCGRKQTVGYPHPRRQYTYVHGIAMQNQWSATSPVEMDKSDDRQAVLTCPTCIKLAAKNKPPVDDSYPAPAPRVLREIIARLEESFDDAKGQYKNGASDVTIAQESGYSFQIVSRIREEYFGPIKPSPETFILEKDIQDFGDKLDELQQEFRALVIRQEKLIGKK